MVYSISELESNQSTFVEGTSLTDTVILDLSTGNNNNIIIPNVKYHFFVSATLTDDDNFMVTVEGTFTKEIGIQ